MSEKRLTERGYWDANYRSRPQIRPVDLEGVRNYCNARIFEIKRRNSFDFRSVLEIGGGGSSWLAFLALKYPASKIAAIDYSADGVRLLEDFAKKNSLENIEVFREDFFNPIENVGEYQFVYSHGVVEHFENLGDAMRAQGRYLAPSGRMFTLIPNLAGVLGPLTNWMDSSVYEIHVPHDLQSFVAGHADAGLNVIESGYLCSVNFGVLSSCVRSDRKLKEFVYKALAKLTTAIWSFEKALVRLPESRLFSPYIYAVSERKGDQ